jgi:hypothetical protein
MPFGVPDQAINVHKRQQPGIQLERLGFAAFPRMTDANLESVIQRDRPISENVIHGVFADRILPQSILRPSSDSPVKLMLSTLIFCRISS